MVYFTAGVVPATFSFTACTHLLVTIVSTVRSCPLRWRCCAKGNVMVQSTYIDTMCVVMYPSPIGVMWCQFVMDNPISHQTMLIELFLTECRHFLLIMCT